MCCRLAGCYPADETGKDWTLDTFLGKQAGRDAAAGNGVLPLGLLNVSSRVVARPAMAIV